jgi:hypothetical protein
MRSVLECPTPRFSKQKRATRNRDVANVIIEQPPPLSGRFCFLARGSTGSIDAARRWRPWLHSAGPSGREALSTSPPRERRVTWRTKTGTLRSREGLVEGGIGAHDHWWVACFCLEKHVCCAWAAEVTLLGVGAGHTSTNALPGEPAVAPGECTRIWKDTRPSRRAGSTVAPGNAPKRHTGDPPLADIRGARSRTNCRASRQCHPEEPWRPEKAHGARI